MLVAGAHDNVLARDLQERDLLLIAQYPGRRVYRLRLVRDTSDAMVRSFEPVRPDSAVATWRQDAAGGGLAALRAATTAGSPQSP